MSSSTPFVSIIIPMRNEEGRIEACLNSILANNYPADCLEIIVVDGRSEDKSREVVERKSQNNPQIRLADNTRQITGAALNIGIRESRGDVIFMINAHARIGLDFLAKNIQTLKEHPEADATGGILVSVQENEMGEAIAQAVNSPLGAGGKRYRTRRTPGLIYDTVPYAAYRRKVFDEIGLIDEELIRNQDAEFNYRLLQRGGKIYFNPEIVSYLHSRSSLGQLAKQQYLTGFWKVRLFQKLFLGRANWRQLVPAIFVGLTLVLGVAGIFSKWGRGLLSALLGTYGLAVLANSLWIKATNSQERNGSMSFRGVYDEESMACASSNRKGLRFLTSPCFVRNDNSSSRFSKSSANFTYLLMAFVTLHFSYGLGTLAGLWTFVVRRKGRESQQEAPYAGSKG